jgi:NDP-sugar pyrophosphorylase family protein
MKAMIFAAGLGTRLRPLTNDRPKAMVEVGGMPMLEIAIRRLKYFGVKEIVVNVHHFGQMIIDFLEANDNFGIHIHISDERDLLLDTGGGLKKALPLLGNAPFIVYNVDILNDIDLKAMYEAHLSTEERLATLAVRKRESSRYLLFDNSGILAGWRNAKTGERKQIWAAEQFNDWAFSGIHIVEPSLFSWMKEEQVFSIIDLYLKAGFYRHIRAYPHDETIWLDMGKPPALAQADQLLPQIPLS